MHRYESKNKSYRLVLTGVMMGIILIATMFFRIPVIATQGYVHLGDAMIFLAVLLLGKKEGAIAAGFGSAMADVIGGYAFFAPWTLLIKLGMAFLMGIFIEAAEKRKPESRSFHLTAFELLGMVLGGAFMTAGYFAVELVIYGNIVTPLAEIPWNIGQFVLGIAVATALVRSLYKTPARRYFAYK